MITLKKIVALSGAIALIAMNAVSFTANTAYAANANPTFTYANGVDTIANTADDVVTVTLPASLTAANGNNLVVVITDSNGAPVNLTGLIGWKTNATLNTANQAAGSVNLNSVVDEAVAVTFAFTPGVAGNFGVSVVNTDGSMGSAVAYVGNANVVTVTAQVVPTLSMNLANTTVSFGTLIPWTINTAATTPVATIKTNATLGYTLQVASANSGLKSGTDMINSATELLDPAWAAALTEGYWIQAVGVGGTIAAPYTAAGNNVWAVAWAANIMTWNKTAWDTATVTLKALANSTTAAGNYSDTLTFTVAGSF